MQDMTARMLIAIQADIKRAKQRLYQLQHEEYSILLTFPCTGCGAQPGHACRKIGGDKSPWPHSNRRREAQHKTENRS